MISRWVACPKGRSYNTGMGVSKSERMTGEMQTKRRQSVWGWSFVLSAAVGFAMLCRLSTLHLPFANDAGLYVAMGKTLLSGGQLYTDLWDTKLPSVAFLTAPVYAVFGDHWWLYIALQSAMGMAIAVVCGWIAKRITGLRAAGLAATTYALVVVNGSLYAASGFQLETPMAFFASLAALVFVIALGEWQQTGQKLARFALWMLLAGVLAGIAAMAKPTGFAVVVAAGVAMVLSIRRLGVAAVIAGAIALCAGCGAVLLVNVALIHHLGLTARLPGVVREIRAYGTGTPWRQVFSSKTAIFVVVAALPAVVVGALAAHRRYRKLPSLTARSALTPITSHFVLYWLAIEVVGVVLQKRVYGYHFLPPMIPAAIAFAMLTAWLDARLLRPWVIGLAMLPVAFAMVVIRLDTLPPFPVSPMREVAAYVRSHTEPGDAIFADNIGTVTVLADRPPGARLGMLIHLINDDTASERFMDQLLSDLDARKPALIILPIDVQGRIRDWESQPILANNPGRRASHRKAWDRLLSYTKQHYTIEKDIASLRIYRRSDSVGQALSEKGV